MHVYFSGIGGTGIGPLALIAHKAGFAVSGSDKRQSTYIDYLKQHGITDIHIGQEYDQIAAVHRTQPIDWLVYTSAMLMEQNDPAELRFCNEHGIRTSKRDAFLNVLLDQKQLKLIAIAGTHGKTTTTAMTIWLMRQLGMPISYSVGAKLSFGDMGEYDPSSEYFVYEADEFDRNFLSFHPFISVITGVDWDHPDIYPTKAAYDDAFREFLAQSKHTVLWKDDARQLGVHATSLRQILDPHDPAIDNDLTLAGHVNRLNAWQVAQAVAPLTTAPVETLIAHLNRFPGVARRFELIAPQLYSDYAHTPPKIRGALQMAHETAGKNVVVIYEGLHNTRQHFIKDELKDLFDDVKHVYVVPSYLAREDPNLPLLQPADLVALLSRTAQTHATPAALDGQLAKAIRTHIASGDLVVSLSAGGGNSLDEWLRGEFAPHDKPNLT